MRFDFPDVIDPLVVPEDIEHSFEIVALSLLLPYLEPYLIRTMKAARKQVTDERLADDLDRFCAQEGQHYRQHKLFNDAVRAFGVEGLAPFEEEIDADYRRFSETKSLRWNLAYAEGFEALTTALAHFSFEAKQAELMTPAARELWHWHLVEEIEHRTVAFDVYDHVCGSYLYRMLVGTWAQYHFMRWTVRVTRHMLRNDPRWKPEELRGRRKARIRLARERLLPKVLRTFSPTYSPRVLAMSSEMQEAAQRYTNTAFRTS